MKTKKNILIIILIVLISITTNTWAVDQNSNEGEVLNILGQEANVDNTKEIAIDSIGMKFRVNQDMYDIIQGLETGDEKVKDIVSAKSNFTQLGIVFDAVDSLDENNFSKEFIIMVSQNAGTQKIGNLSSVSEEELSQVSEDFFQELKEATEEVTFDETKTTKSQNGNVYMVAISHQEIEKGTVNTATYYTVVAKRLVAITFRYLNKKIDHTEISQMIESTTFDTEKIEAEEQTALVRTFVTYGIMGLAIIILGIIERKTFQKKTIKIEEKDKKEYQKMGGFFLVFIVTLGLTVLNSLNSFSSFNELEQTTFKIIFYIQNIVSLLLIIGIVFLLLKKKEEKTPRRIEKILIIMGIINILSSVIRIIISFNDTQTFYMTQYYLQEAMSILTNLAYMIVWSTYFVVSKRIHVYYQIPFETKTDK